MVPENIEGTRGRIYIALDARRCRLRNAPMSRLLGFGGGVHRLWLRSRTVSSRYARNIAVSLMLKHSIVAALVVGWSDCAEPKRRARQCEPPRPTENRCTRWHANSV